MWQCLKELLVSFGNLFLFSLILILSVINPRERQLVLEEQPAFGSRHSAATNYFENTVKQLISVLILSVHYQSIPIWE